MPLARDMPPNMAYNPTQAFYTQPSGLEPKYAYILMSLWSLNKHASALVENRPPFGKPNFSMHAKYIANMYMKIIYALSGEDK